MMPPSPESGKWKPESDRRAVPAIRSFIPTREKSDAGKWRSIGRIILSSVTGAASIWQLRRVGAVRWRQCPDSEVRLILRSHAYELRKSKGHWQIIELVWLWFRTPHAGLAAVLMRISEPPHKERAM